MTSAPTARSGRRGIYRFLLTRTWDAARPALAWVMLNPSTATESVDDPTIRRVVAFSRKWGFGGLEVVNLFALRATRPAELAISADPVGPDNDEALVAATASAKQVIVAWGDHGSVRNPVTGVRRAEEVLELIGPRPLRCLGTTRRGHPRHPLYLPADTGTQPFPGVNRGRAGRERPASPCGPR